VLQRGTNLKQFPVLLKKENSRLCTAYQDQSDIAIFKVTKYKAANREVVDGGWQ
jgi:hypothetical protein